MKKTVVLFVSFALAIAAFAKPAGRGATPPEMKSVSGVVKVTDSVATLTASDGTQYTLRVMDGKGGNPPAPPSDGMKGNPPPDMKGGKPPKPVTMDELRALSGKKATLSGFTEGSDFMVMSVTN